jgi:hypothetical protein
VLRICTLEFGIHLGAAGEISRPLWAETPRPSRQQRDREQAQSLHVNELQDRVLLLQQCPVEASDSRRQNISERAEDWVSRRMHIQIEQKGDRL